MKDTVEYFIDFEASGLHPDSYPIEIGICGPDFEYSALVKPSKHWTHWDANAADMHGISRDSIESDGIDAFSICRFLNDRFPNATLWSDSSYDAMWMSVLFEAAEVLPLFQVKNILSIINQSQLPDYFNAQSDSVEHRALADAKEIRRCWLAYYKMA